MIVIKIKTWKDYEEQFLDWVREPRKRRCKEYVDYVNAISSSYIENLLIPKCKELQLKECDTEIIAQTAEKCFQGAVEYAKNLIEVTQPKDLI